MTLEKKEQTGPQVASLFGADIFVKAMPATYATYRTMRKDPTIAMTRSLIHATVQAGEWSIAADDDVDDEQIKVIQDALLRWRSTIIQHAVFGGIDFGWAGFEIIWRFDGTWGIEKIKPLLQDLTTILIHPDTGELRGYRQRSVTTAGGSMDLMAEYLLHTAFRIEGTDWYGEALLEYARATYNKWLDADAGAARYDKKVAGSHFVIYYPLGTTKYEGAEMDNAEIAKILLRALESSGSVMVPDQLSDFVTKENDERPRWKIDIVSDSTARQPTFIDRLKYLDALKVRALLVPERSILEGEFGTKAEAGVHAEAAVINLQQLDQAIVDMVNKQIVNRLLEQNYGPDAIDTIRLEAAPLTSEKLILLRAVYEKILANPQGFLEEFGEIDTDAIKDQLGIPKREEVAPAIDEEEEIVELPPPGATEEELALLAGHRVRLVDDTLSVDVGGLVDRYGTTLATAEATFSRAARLVKGGLFDEARRMLFAVPRPDDPMAHLEVQKRIIAELSRIVSLERKSTHES